MVTLDAPGWIDAPSKRGIAVAFLGDLLRALGLCICLVCSKLVAAWTSVCPDSLLRYRANAVVSFGIRRYKIVTSWLTKPLNTLEVSEGS